MGNWQSTLQPIATHETASEDEASSLLGAIDAVVYALSPDGRELRYLSPGAEKLLGGAAQRMRQDPEARHATVLAPDRPRLEALARHLAENDGGEVEYRLAQEDGSILWLRERCRLQRSADGLPWRLIGTLVDVTLSRRLIDSLRDSEARFRSLVELSSDWYWQQDAEFRFIEFSGAPAGPAGRYVNASLLGRRRWEGGAFICADEVWAVHQATLARHEPFQDFEYGIELPEGDRVYFSSSGEPVYDERGNFRGYRGVGRDITARRRMEEALRENEARLLLVLEATTEGVWDYDVRAGDTYFSLHFAELLGYGSQAELKKNFRFADALHPEDRAAAVAAQERTLSQGLRFDQTYRLRCRDGSYRWFHGRGIAVAEPGGPVLRFVGAIADVTAQKAAELELRRLSVAIEQSPVSIVITDIAGNIEYVNPRFCQVTGYSFLEVRGRNPRLLKSGQMDPQVYVEMWNALTQGRQWSGELHNRKKSGEYFWEAVRIFPLLSDTGKITHFMALREDITLKKEVAAREALRQEEMRHHARLAAMGEMAAALAHELNQPLAAIANFSDVALHALSTEPANLGQAGELARLIKSQALRAGEIVWRIREFSKKQAPRREATDLNLLIRDVVRLADIAARHSEIVFDFDLAPELPEVAVDRVQIEQVLLNLIRNGVEAMEGMTGERRLSLTSRLAEGETAVQIAVSDRGCGLPNRIAVDLFTPFFSTKSQGLGMGLAISRGIVEAHGGKLWAGPNEGGGTTFQLILPLGTSND
ncbi:two-component system, LuxR family, sensor histidine kinase DctS [Burkholderiales bacterium]|nr:two-component system, LuxR family, sensor histidine kinase DctS [Burkholderiales bacterium]